MAKKKQETPTKSATTKSHEMTKAEREEALTLLREPEILSMLLDDLERIGCVGEHENKLMIALALTSRLGDSPIGLICKGESSSGKSFTVSSVASFFPPEDVLMITSLSAKALYHYTDSLEHKALIICERPGAEAADYSIRALLSEKEISLMLAETGQKPGQFTTVTKKVKGPIAYIETTTKTHLNPENENRCFELSPDESPEQTRRIQAYQRSQADRPPIDREPIVRRWRNAQRLLEPLTVLIPFGFHIEFPSDTVRARRDFPRFLSLIQATALIHQKQRTITVKSRKRMLVANILDYAIAFELAKSVLVQTKTGLSPAAKVVLDAVASMIDARKSSPNDEHPDRDFTAQEVVDASGLSQRTVQRYLSVCRQSGYIEVVDAKKGCSHRYRFIRSSRRTQSGLLDPDELEARWTSTKSPTVPEVRQEVLSDPKLNQAS